MILDCEWVPPGGPAIRFLVPSDEVIDWDQAQAIADWIRQSTGLVWAVRTVVNGAATLYNPRIGVSLVYFREFDEPYAAPRTTAIPSPSVRM